MRKFAHRQDSKSLHVGSNPSEKASLIRATVTARIDLRARAIQEARHQGRKIAETANKLHG